MKEKLLGDKIRDARKQAGLTQWQLANKIFVSESYIALIESNKRNPSTDVLSKIAEALGMTTDHMLCDTVSRSTDSFALDFCNLVKNRSPEEIDTALQLIRKYFECLDELN